VFLDRDGTLVEHVHHLTDPADVRLLPGAGDAVRRLRERGYACVLVTNQSVVGRGLLTVEGLGRVHAELVRQLAREGAALDDWRWCATVPATGDRSVVEDPDRKPGPGMLLASARALSLDLPRSWMVGDMVSDTLAGRAAGCRTVLLRTGLHDARAAADPSVDHVCDDLSAAASLIVRLDAVPSPSGAGRPA
jgi:D-glycero-D-manno-heptose 1,7-bisphosphate phosphatase